MLCQFHFAAFITDEMQDHTKIVTFKPVTVCEFKCLCRHLCWFDPLCYFINVFNAFNPFTTAKKVGKKNRKKEQESDSSCDSKS